MGKNEILKILQKHQIWGVPYFQTPNHRYSWGSSDPMWSPKKMMAKVQHPNRDYLLVYVHLFRHELGVWRLRSCKQMFRVYVNLGHAMFYFGSLYYTTIYCVYYMYIYLFIYLFISCVFLAFSIYFSISSTTLEPAPGGLGISGGSAGAAGDEALRAAARVRRGPWRDSRCQSWFGWIIRVDHSPINDQLWQPTNQFFRSWIMDHGAMLKEWWWMIRWGRIHQFWIISPLL